MRLSGFLSDLLEMFEAHPGGLIFDEELVGFFRVALEKAVDAADVLERTAVIVLEEGDKNEPETPYAVAVKRQQLARDFVPLDADRSVLIMPNAIRMNVPIMGTIG